METISTSWSSDFGPHRHFELLTSCTTANKHRNVYHTILVSILSFIQTEGGGSIHASCHSPEWATTHYAFSSCHEGSIPRVPIPKFAKFHPSPRGRPNQSSVALYRSGQRVIGASSWRTLDTHRSVDHVCRETDVLGFQSNQRVLASRWFYLPVDKRYSDIIEPKVTLYGFVDRREEVDTRNL